MSVDFRLLNDRNAQHPHYFLEGCYTYLWSDMQHPANQYESLQETITDHQFRTHWSQMRKDIKEAINHG